MHDVTSFFRFLTAKERFFSKLDLQTLVFSKLYNFARFVKEGFKSNRLTYNDS